MNTTLNRRSSSGNSEPELKATIEKFRAEEIGAPRHRACTWSKAELTTGLSDNNQPH